MKLERRLQLGSWHWLDITEASETELAALFAKHELPSSLAADCLDPSALPKLQQYPTSAFIMLRAFDEKSAPRASTVQSMTRKLAVVWGDNFVVTVHRAQMPWLDQVWARWEKKGAGEAHLLVHDLVEDCLYTFEPPIDRGAEEIEELEDKIFAEKSTKSASTGLLAPAYLVKKRAFQFKRLLRLTRDMLPTVSRVGAASMADLQYLKEEADRLFFYADDLGESANDLVQLSISLSSNRMNELVRMLTIVSLFLMPLNLITGIYGMNFENMPELKEPYGYAGTILLMALLALTTYWILRRRGWIRARNPE